MKSEGPSPLALPILFRDGEREQALIAFTGEAFPSGTRSRSRV
jgi:hypothetical protein